MSNRPLIIGISGGTSCGKSTVAYEIRNRIQSYTNDLKIDVLSQDNSYKTLCDNEIEQAFRSEYNFDHPEAQDNKQFKEWLSNIKQSNRVVIPVYDFSTHSHSSKTPDIIIDGCDVVIVEGLFLFYHPEMRDLFDYKIFVDVNDDERLSRRIRRDTKHRGRTIDTVLNEWERFAQPGFEQFIFPTKKFVDIIVPRGGENKVAIDMIAAHITKELLYHN